MTKFWQHPIAIGCTCALLALGAFILWNYYGGLNSNNPSVCHNNSSRSLLHPLVYVPSEKRCFQLFSQGPCRKQNWLVMEARIVRCIPNGCVDHFDNTDVPVVSFNKTCYKLGDRCGKRAGGVIRYEDSGDLNCSVPVSLGNVGHTGYGSCPSGTFRFQGSCTAPVDVILD